MPDTNRPKPLLIYSLPQACGHGQFYFINSGDRILEKLSDLPKVTQ